MSIANCLEARYAPDFHVNLVVIESICGTVRESLHWCVFKQDSLCGALNSEHLCSKLREFGSNYICRYTTETATGVQIMTGLSRLNLYHILTSHIQKFEALLILKCRFSLHTCCQKYVTDLLVTK